MLEREEVSDSAVWQAFLEKGALYLVAVPIGNLGDFTLRALHVLSQVDIVACEEVQATRRLFNAQGLSAHLVSYRESGRESSGAELVSAMLAGQTVAYVSGAGMPAISDPGRDLVERCHQKGIKVIPVPGASALTAAVASAGLPCRRFVFEGFIPRNDGERLRYFQSLAHEERTLVFYEAPHRLLSTVQAMLECWGARRCFVGRELTKRFEQCWLADLPAVAEHFAEVEPRGEFVLVVAGNPGSDEDEEQKLAATIEADLQWLDGLEIGSRQRAEILSHFRNVPRNRAKRFVLDFDRAEHCGESEDLP